jgi:multiple sugar transport system substrate-binding protein
MKTTREEVRVASRLIDSVRRGEITRRDFMLLAAGLSGAAFLAACSPSATPSSSSGPKKGIPFWTAEDDPATQKFYAAAKASFEKDHPDVDIQIRYIQEVATDQALQVAALTSVDFAVFTPTPNALSNYVNAKWLAPLTDVVNKIGADDFTKGTRFVLNGDDWAIPYQFNSFGLYYRKDLFQKAGLKDPPTTYEDVLGAAQTLNGKDGILGMIALVSPSGGQGLISLSPFVYQSGWDYFSRDGKLTFGQPEVLEGIKRAANVLQYSSTSFFNAGYQDVSNAWTTGRAAMVLQYGGALAVATDQANPKVSDVTGIIGPPAGSFMTGQLCATNPQVYVLYAKAKYPDEAKQWIQFITTGDRALEFALTRPGHLLSALKTVQKQQADPSNAMVAGNAYMKKHADWVNTFTALQPYALQSQLSMGNVNAHKFAGMALDVCPWGDKIWAGPGGGIDLTMLQQILVNKRDPEQAWTEAVSKMDQVRKTWLDQNPTWTPPSF